MSRNKVVVTFKENVQEAEDGEVILLDEDCIGHALQTHVYPVNYEDPETKVIQTGLKILVEVYWEHARTPACTMESPESLYWLNFGDEDLDEDEEARDDEDDEDYEREINA